MACMMCSAAFASVPGSVLGEKNPILHLCYFILTYFILRSRFSPQRWIQQNHQGHNKSVKCNEISFQHVPRALLHNMHTYCSVEFHWQARGSNVHLAQSSRQAYQTKGDRHTSDQHMHKARYSKAQHSTSQTAALNGDRSHFENSYSVSFHT